MRSFGIVSPQFWTGRTGKEIQKVGPDAQIVALYLMTSPHSHMCGLYYIPKQYIAYETGRPLKTVDKALKVLAGLPSGAFAEYDDVTEHVWIPEMLRHQVGPLTPGDNKIKAISTWYRSLPASTPFLEAFFNRYREEVPDLVLREAPSKGLRRVVKPPTHSPDPVSSPAPDPASSERGLGETKKSAEVERKTGYGVSGAVQLTPTEYEKCKVEFDGYCDSLIQDLDNYSGTNPKKFRQYSDHVKVLRTFYRNGIRDGRIHPTANSPPALHVIEPEEEPSAEILEQRERERRRVLETWEKAFRAHQHSSKCQNGTVCIYVESKRPK